MVTLSVDLINNYTHPVIIDNMIAKFDQDILNGLFSIMLYVDTVYMNVYCEPYL